MRPFVARDGHYVARLDETERAVLADLTEGVATLLGAPDLDDEPAARDWPPAWAAEGSDEDAGRSPDAADHSDPAVRRLLPDGSRDPAEAAEFRRLAGEDVRLRKVDGLRTWRRALHSPQGRRGNEVVVTPAQADAVAAALTDLRLVLAERLEIRTEQDTDRRYAEAAAPDPPGLDEAEIARRAVRRAFVAMYDVLSVLQETLVTAMLADARRRTSRGRAGAG
ncbi:DUF2017 family protein [Cellulomonas composti]|uniref:Uncharacterized protein n=1 Tax=Cellulomonas composti TaxID=266130 RepID=A0A511J9U3_9CELL|nr:DUF2017 family protein [Cellulomonas composti]GEL94761.1 hypothetical protein CCO02nite_14190 [Cellulomonas composti]